MRRRLLTATAAALLAALPCGCIGHKPVQAEGPPDAKQQQTAASTPSEYFRTMLRISAESTESNAAALAALHEKEPELAELHRRASLNPTDLAAARLLAAAYLEHGLPLNAFELYQQIRIQAPQDVDVELGLARAWDLWKDYEMALQHAMNAVSLAPKSVIALETLGRIHLHRNEPDAALAAFRSALAMAPENGALHANAGYALLLKNDWHEARRHLETAVRLDGPAPETRNNLGIVLALLGDREGAIREFSALAGPAVAHNNLGVAYLSQGQYRKAWEEFQQAIALEPNYELALANLKEVESLLPVIETHESPIELASASPPPHTAYTIQVLSTKNWADAQAATDALAKAGVKATIQQTDLKERGVWYRARVSGFESFEAALEAAKKMLMEGLIGDFWIVQEKS